MQPNLFYPTTYSPAGGFTATNSITNITYPDDLKNDIAYPYYMGYVLEKDLPLLFKPKKFVQDENQIGLYHLTDAFPAQNYSWLYMLKDENSSWNGFGNAIYKDLTDDEWKYLTTGYQYAYRFINAGMMANLNLLLIGVQYNMVKMVEDTINETFTVSAPSTMNLTYNQIYELIHNNGTITYSNITFSQSDFDSATGFYKQVDQSDATKINYIAFLDIRSTIPTYKTGGNPNIQIKPFLKFENADNGEIAYITPSTINADHRIWARQDGDAYNVIFNNIVVSGSTYGNMLSVYDYIFPNCEGDIDIADLYDKRGYYYQVNTNKIFNYTGSIRYDDNYYLNWAVWQPINPVEFLKYFNLYNKYTFTNNNTYILSSTYFTGLGVNYFNDDNVPLWTGKLPTDTYTYSDIVSDLQPWQLVGVDISANRYDDTDKPDPDVPPQADDEITTAKHNDENSLPALSGIRTVSGDAFSTFYHLSLYHVAELGQLISQMPQSFWEALGTATDYKQANILDYLVSLKWYPLNVVDSTDTITSDLQFGFNGSAKITFTAAGTSYKIGNINRIYDMGSITIPYRGGAQSFLDLEPYTSVSAYLPYIGTVSLQANDVIGYTITCTYIVDLTTGMCTGILDNGTDTIYIGTGKIGVDISASGNDVLTQAEKMASSYIGAASSTISNTLSLGASVADANVAGAASAMTSAVTDLASSAIGIANSKRGIPETVGSASGFGGGYTHQAPYIRVQRPAVSIPSKYGHDVGYVCNRSYTIGTLSGYTVCGNPDLSGIPATSAELDMIRALLMSGFYA